MGPQTYIPTLFYLCIPSTFFAVFFVARVDALSGGLRAGAFWAFLQALGVGFLAALAPAAARGVLVDCGGSWIRMTKYP